jgi:L-ascorbate metabolism protein UlaG (beta-lactamase superfamily)
VSVDRRFGVGVVSFVRFLGHATVLVDLGGSHILTDPVLTDRVLFIRRVAEAITAPPTEPRAILISHAHHDHLHQPSMSRFPRDLPVFVPRGLGRVVARWGFGSVTEMRAGDEAAIGGVTVTAVPALHSGRREPAGPTGDTLGFVIAGEGRTVYFAGDTDLFDEMEAIGSRGIDVALIPVWGWGPRLGPGHLDPERAAEAVARIRPTVVIPIHWGTLWPLAMWWRRRRLVDPPIRLAREVRRRDLRARVEVIEPGGTFDLDEMRREAA